MRAERNPLDGKCPDLVNANGAATEFGRQLRKAEAQTRLKEMESAEELVAREEQRSRGLVDRLARSQALHRLNMQYLLEFGVAADERDAFREILAEVSVHGGLTLREASNLAHARVIGQREKGRESSVS